MPLSEASERREIHHRVIDMKAYARTDGLYEVEARLVDRKPFAFQRLSNPEPIAPGEPLHDLSIRLTLDERCVVQKIEASSDVTPHTICKGAESTLQVLVGERIAKGWSQKVKERLRGAASCTHLMEMLLPIATTALQGIYGAKRERGETIAPEEVPAKIDSCFAYAAHREVVQQLWPQHYRAQSSDAGRD